MKFVIQRVSHASVTVDGTLISSIEKGFMVLIGVCDADTKETADKLVKKLLGLRIFEDADGKTNLALKDVNGQLLLVSQFTLYADCKKGNRLSFTDSAAPDIAKELYEKYSSLLLENGVRKVENGIFAADMKVSLVNDGPVTIMLDTDIWRKDK